jgi:hypothetical protein
MKHYALAPRAVLDLPAQLFWMMVRQIDRLQAEEDLRGLKVALAAQSAEGVKELAADLQRILGEIAKRAPVYERSKMRALMGRIEEEDRKRRAAGFLESSGVPSGDDQGR